MFSEYNHEIFLITMKHFSLIQNRTHDHYKINYPGRFLEKMSQTAELALLH